MSDGSSDQTTSDVVVKDNGTAHQYEAHIGDELAGLTTYRREDGKIVFLHAEVYPKWEGRGVGSELARGALDDAVSQQLTITPQCPFIADYISRNPSYLQHVDDDDRQRIEAEIATGPDDEVA
jgi:predicted GNAT family acetyltransferase